MGNQTSVSFTVAIIYPHRSCSHPVVKAFAWMVITVFIYSFYLFVIFFVHLCLSIKPFRAIRRRSTRIYVRVMLVVTRGEEVEGEGLMRMSFRLRLCPNSCIDHKQPGVCVCTACKDFICVSVGVTQAEMKLFTLSRTRHCLPSRENDILFPRRCAHSTRPTGACTWAAWRSHTYGWILTETSVASGGCCERHTASSQV